jgi:hypothetical protein
MKKKYFLLLFGSLYLAVACRQTLPKDRMVDLLTDMYLYENELAKEIQGADSVSIYRSVFIRHGYTEEEYRNAIACYAKKPKEMKEIYETVKLRLEDYKAQFEQAWQLKNYMQTAPPHDTLYYVTFDDDSTRRIYLPKFRTAQQQPDSVLIVIPWRPVEPEQSDEPVQPEQPVPPVQPEKSVPPAPLKQPEQPVQLKHFKQLERSAHPVRPERAARRPVRLDSLHPAELLQPLP